MMRDYRNLNSGIRDDRNLNTAGFRRKMIGVGDSVSRLGQV